MTTSNDTPAETTTIARTHPHPVGEITDQYGFTVRDRALLFAYVGSPAAETSIPLNDDDIAVTPSTAARVVLEEDDTDEQLTDSEWGETLEDEAFWANAARVAAETQPDEGVVLDDDEPDDEITRSERELDCAVVR